MRDKIGLFSTLCWLLSSTPAIALPPPEDPPEEILRTEIILDARSRLDGEPLTAAEYAQEQAEIAESPYPPELDPAIQEVIFLLRIRQLLKPIIPFIP
jgi:hypothetical protein